MHTLATMKSENNSVLVIEDDAIIAESLSELLEFEGYEVHCASNGLEGLEFLQNNRPSIILLDLMMPVKDGMQFRREQLEDAELATIPVIVMSADTQAKQKSEQMQANGFLKKPFDIEAVLELVNNVKE